MAVELVLYVDRSDSPAARAAESNLARVLGACDPQEVHLQVRPAAAAELGSEAPAFPLLMRVSPLPRQWIRGTFREADLVAGVLRSWGVPLKVA